MRTRISRRTFQAITIFLVVLGPIFLAACQQNNVAATQSVTTDQQINLSSAQSLTTDELVLNEAQSGCTVQLGDHKTARIELAGNISTGFLWSLSKMDGDCLVQVGDVEWVPHQPVMPGSGSTIIFRFRPVKIGQTTITLAYARSWEKSTPPARTFTVTVVVGKVPAAAAMSKALTEPGRKIALNE